MFQGWWQKRRDGERARTAEFHPSVEVLEDRLLLSVTLVGDINRTTQPAFPISSDQISSAAIGNMMYFTASDGQHANELWRSDGTASGTMLVKAIDGPGLTPDSPSTIDHITALGSQVVFTVDDGIHGNEVWISDGTGAGTHLLQDINKGQAVSPDTDGASSNACDFVVAGNHVFFTAEDATHGRELWVSNGTSDGTFLVRDLDPFNSVPYADGPSDLTAFNGQVYFYARDAADGRELWTSDGTKQGTHMVADLNRGPGDGAPQDDSNNWPGNDSGSMMAVMGNALYFVADNGYSGLELYRTTNGYWSGTSEVRDIRGGMLNGSPVGSDPAWLTTVNGLLYFTTDDGIHGRSLWSSDGTSHGTHIVASPNAAGFASLQDIRQLTAFGSELAFVTTTSTGGEGLWVSDGTTGGTQMLKEIAPQQTISPPLVQAALIPYGSNSQDLLPNGNTLYFTALDPVHGRELWKTDGTLKGTALVSDIRYGPAGSQIGLIAAQGNHILLAANDGRFGRELWTSDGTYEGTRLIRDINRLPNDANPSAPVQAGTRLFFSADDGVHGEQLWMTDTTTGQTQMVKCINQTVGPTWLSGGDVLPQGANIHDMVALNGVVYFGANDGIHGDELWVSDGTDAGTHMVTDINTQPPGPWFWMGAGLNGGASISQVAVMNGQIYFAADDGIHGDELWTSDGTSAGTHMVKDIDTQGSSSQPIPLAAAGTTPSAALPGWNPGNGSSSPWDLTVIGNRLYFAANDGIDGEELWVSDGTAAGTKMLKDINPEASGPNPTPQDSNPSNLTRVGSNLFFTADDGKHGVELWRTDGTAQGTRMVSDINRTTSTPAWSNGPIPGSSYPSNLTAVGSALYFTADDGVNGIGLWKSDGSGTILVHSLGATLSDGTQVSVNEMTAVGSKLFFSTDAGGNGTELWTSDGTTVGTHMVVDLYPGSSTVPYAPYVVPNSSSPSNLTAFRGKLYFIANDATHGRELWSSDGTAAGTVLVVDATAGQASGFSWASGLTAIGNTLYFSASDGKTGVESWKLS